MRHISLYATCLAICFCGTVAAQHPSAKAHENPCALFKMRIVVPDNSIDFKMRVQKFNSGIDSRMVLNVCPQSESQFAFALVEPAAAPRSSGFQFPTLKSREKKQAEFPFSGQLSPFTRYLQH